MKQPSDPSSTIGKLKKLSSQGERQTSKANKFKVNALLKNINFMSELVPFYNASSCLSCYHIIIILFIFLGSDYMEVKLEWSFSLVIYSGVPNNSSP